jgi:hypothetical protein
MLVGVLRDPAHGFVLTLGAGGVLTELLQDTVSLLVPATARRSSAALSRLRLAPLLDGYRGRRLSIAPRWSRPSCRAGLRRGHADELLELEINPLIATPTRAVAVDALIRMGDGG